MIGHAVLRPLGAGDLAWHLDRLLERWAVDPGQQPLGDRPQRAKPDRVVAGLVAVAPGLLADGVAPVELGGADAQRVAQRALERRPAGGQRAVSAIDPRHVGRRGGRAPPPGPASRPPLGPVALAPVGDAWGGPAAASRA